MSNTRDGGKIILGVRNDDFEPIGMTADDYESFDPTTLNDLLEKYTEPKHSCLLYKKEIDGNKFIIIDIPEFTEEPIICKKDANSSLRNNKIILKKPYVYIRTKKATTEIIPTVQEMRELLGRSIAKKGDKLLHSIELLIKGKPIETSSEEKLSYSKEIAAASDFLKEKLNDYINKYGYWEFYAHPTSYIQTRVNKPNDLKEYIQKSEVRLRGWDFPHTSWDTASSFTRGWQSYTISDRVNQMEGYRVYQSGLFIFKGILEEDLEFNSSNGFLLSYINTIWSITEFFLFLKRYYKQISSEEDIYYCLILNKAKDRQLISANPSIKLSENYICEENTIKIEGYIKGVELSASFKGIANSVIQKIFWGFKASDIAEQTIDQWQTQLLEKKL